jgi:hypothetical protein
MKAIYAAGKTQHIISPHDECCPHLHQWKIAPYYTAQIVGPIRTVFYTCKSCHEALQNEIAQNFILCNDCRKPMAPEEVICWSPYDSNPAEPTIYLCKDCECGTKHFDRVEYDRANFVQSYPVKQRNLRLLATSDAGMNMRYIPEPLRRRIDQHIQS